MKIKDLVESYSELELSDDILKQLGIEIKVDRFEEPKHGEKYYYIEENGLVYVTNYVGGEHDKLANNAIIKGNCYPKKHFTREEVEEIARQKLEYDVAVWELKREIARLNDGWTPNWEDGNKEKYIIYNEEGEFKCLSWYTCKYVPNWMHLKSHVLCEQLIKTHKKQLKIYFEIE